MMGVFANRMSPVHKQIGSVNGAAWLNRWKQVHELITPAVLRERVTSTLHGFDTDLVGSGVYAKESDTDSQTRYDVVNAWQVNYVRGRCALNGGVLGAELQSYSDEALFQDFYSSRPARCVLDVGCNTGKNLARAALYGGPKTEVWGIEYSGDSVCIAQAAHGTDRIFQGDASGDFVTMHGWEQKFTAVQCTAVLQHMLPQQVEAVISNMAKSLRADGELLLTFKDAPTAKQMQEKRMDAWAHETFSADHVSQGQYLKDGFLHAVMWDDDYYPDVTSDNPLAERNLARPGLHRREFVFYSLEWIIARAEKHGLQPTDVEVHLDSKIPCSALHWKVVFRAGAKTPPP
jgi:SAM-dependent methyltransferase